LGDGHPPADAAGATASAATRLAAHLGAGRVEAGDAVPAGLAGGLREALRAAQR
jgi:hypothetical protein